MILQGLSPDALSAYGRNIDEWFRARVPMDLGPPRVSDRFVEERARSLVRNSRWPQGEEQFVEFALMISRLSEASDRQGNAAIQWMGLTVAPHDPHLAELLAAAATGKRVRPGTAIQTPRGGIVFDAGGLGEMSAEAVSLSSNSDLVLALAALLGDEDDLRHPDLLPRVPDGFVGRVDSFKEIFRVGRTAVRTVRVKGWLDAARKFLRTAVAIKEVIDDVESEELQFLIELELHVRKLDDEENANEIEELVGIYTTSINCPRELEYNEKGIVVPGQDTREC